MPRQGLNPLSVVCLGLFSSPGSVSEVKRDKRLLWVSPKWMRSPNPPSLPTQAGGTEEDVRPSDLPPAGATSCLLGPQLHSSPSPAAAQGIQGMEGTEGIEGPGGTEVIKGTGGTGVED